MRVPATHHWRKYHEATQAWVSTRTDATHACRAAAGLAEWLGEYPEHAADIQRLGLSGTALALQRQEWEAAQRLAAAGLDAALLRPLRTAEDLGSATQLCLFAATAATALDDVLAGRVLLERANETLASMEAPGPMNSYLLFQRCALAGELAESSLEDLRAAQEFHRALEIGQALRADEQAMIALEGEWGALLFGDAAAQQPDLTHELVSQGFDWMLQNALLGRARTARDADAAREALAMCAKVGLPVGRPLLSLHRIILNLAPEDIDAAVAGCLDQARRLDEPLRRAWTIALSAGQATAHARDGRFTLAGAALDEPLQAGARPTDTVALSLWFGAHVIMQFGGHKAGAARDILRTFLRLFQDAAQQLAGGPTYLPFRAACELPFASAIEHAFKRSAESGGTEARRELAVLMDALREPEGSSANLSNEASPAYKAIELAGDKLGRLSHALRDRHSTVALIFQSIGDQTLFVCASSDAAEPLVFAHSGAKGRDAMRALTAGAEAAVWAETVDEGELTKLGKSAYRALPAMVRSRLAAAETILFVPDFSTGLDRLPFELFHDGRNFLGLGKVVARCLSIAHAVTIAERGVLRRAQPHRALCMAVPEAPGLQSLEFAAAEVDDVCSELRAHGWDVETFSPVEATPEAVLQVMPLTGVLHAATHGEASAGAEGVVLANGVHLGATEVISCRHDLRGLVYLNACSLGQSRYLGGGVSRGMASAFARAGASSVVANLLPVEDRCAASIAIEFYRNAGREPVGEALRNARGAAAAQGDTADLWSASVLLGDPFYRMNSSCHDDVDATGRLFAGVEVPAPKRLTSARAELKRNSADVRLAAAVAWSEAMRSRAAGKPFEELARAARDIGHPIGEAHCLLLHADAQRRAHDKNGLAIALRNLIRALAPLRGHWARAYEAHRAADAELQAMDGTHKPRTLPAIRLKSGLTINDRSDPAVAAILDMQDAMDEHEQRWRGEVSLRIPDLTVCDIAWNAAVWGYKFRLFGTGGEAGYVGQLAARLVWRKLVPIVAETNLRLILSGLLPFLWGQQRQTHLDHWMAQAHANIVRLAIESVNSGWVPPVSSPAALLAAEALASLDAALAAAGGNSGISKYARARHALAGGQPATAAIYQLENSFNSLLDRCQRDHPKATGDLAAWLMGLVAERAYRANGPNARQDQAVAFRTIADALTRRAENLLSHYLDVGFAPVRETAGLDLLARWSMAET